LRWCWPAVGLCVLAGGCGLQVRSPDLFQLTRTGQTKPVTLIVNDGGTIRCNGGPTKPISNPLLLQARALVTNLDKDAKRKLRLPAGPGSVFSYSVRFQNGTVTFADNSTARNPELAQAELFALRAARDACGVSG
jgi:hypothetical protein